MKAKNARLNGNGGWCVRKMLTYKEDEKLYHVPNEFLGKYSRNGMYGITILLDHRWGVMRHGR